MSDDLILWTVYRHPKDYPGQYVARKWTIRNGKPVATDTVYTAPSLHAIRDLLPGNLIMVPRSQGDDPNVVETWL